jgi:hypothetical protein
MIVEDPVSGMFSCDTAALRLFCCGEQPDCGTLVALLSGVHPTGCLKWQSERIHFAPYRHAGLFSAVILFAEAFEATAGLEAVAAGAHPAGCVKWQSERPHAAPYRHVSLFSAEGLELVEDDGDFGCKN